MNPNEDPLEQMREDWEVLSSLVDKAVAPPDAVRVRTPLPSRRFSPASRTLRSSLLRLLLSLVGIGVVAVVDRGGVPDAYDLVPRLVVGGLFAYVAADALTLLAALYGCGTAPWGRNRGPYPYPTSPRMAGVAAVAGLAVILLTGASGSSAVEVCGVMGHDVAVDEVRQILNLINPLAA